MILDVSEDGSVEEGGTGVHREVLGAVEGITEEEIKGQGAEMDRLAKERAKRRKSREDSSENEMEGREEEYNRLREELRKEGAQKRKRGEGGGQEGEGGKGGERGEEAGERNERGRRQKSGPDEKKLERAVAQRKAKRSNRAEQLRQDATRFATEWGVARLKGVDLSECSGVLVEDGKACMKDLNKGVKAQSEGNVVLMK